MIIQKKIFYKFKKFDQLKLKYNKVQMNTKIKSKIFNLKECPKKDIHKMKLVKLIQMKKKEVKIKKVKINWIRIRVTNNLNLDKKKTKYPFKNK